jgi:hypothetical protein
MILKGHHRDLEWVLLVDVKELLIWLDEEVTDLLRKWVKVSERSQLSRWNCIQERGECRGMCKLSLRMLRIFGYWSSILISLHVQ